MWVTAVTVFSFCACKKELNNGEVDNSSYYIKGTFNGQARAFSYNPSAADFSGDITASFKMSAEDNVAAAEFALNIIHPFGIPVSTGSYSEIATGYIPSGYYRVGDALSYSSSTDANRSTLHIAIAVLNSTTVAGTFSGYLRNTRDTSAVINIANGRFNLPVH